MKKMALCRWIFVVLLSSPILQAKEASPAQQAEARALVAEEQELSARLEALRERKKQLTQEIDEGKPSPENSSGGLLSTNAPAGQDSVGAWFTEFRTAYDLKVRQSVFDKSGLEEPALFQYTMPTNGEDSWQADIGISVAHDLKRFGDLPGRPSWRLLGDYHYNEAKGALKDTAVAAAGIDFLFGSDTESAQPVSLEAGYKRDNLVSGEGITGSLVWFPTLAVRGIGDFWYPFGLVTGRVKPFVGLEGESGNGGIKRFPSGERWTAKAGVSLIGLILPEQFGNRLETALTFGWWNHLSTSGGYDAYDDNQTYFSSTITYWLDRGKDGGDTLTEEEKHFGLSVRYVNGDNPSKGEFDADAWTFGLSVKF